MGKAADDRVQGIDMNSTVLVASWSTGLITVNDGMPHQELANHSVRWVKSDGHGGAIAIVDGRSLFRRSSDGVWSTIATTKTDLACCVAVGEAIYAGTDDAQVLRINAAGDIATLPGFEQVPGRDKWYAGTAVIEGKVVGPPLGVRSITATSDGSVLLANVHVGGIPRSIDAGETWQPTIDVDSDVHQVRAHPSYPNIVAAASAIGLCISSDGGATWEIEQRGLHALHCSAVAFAGDHILVSASEGPFAPRGAIYRRGMGEQGPLARVTGGLPEWLDGRADTGCIAVNGSAVAIADASGNLYLSPDGGRSWSLVGKGIPSPSGVLIV
ncbi:MAG TPA: hypothetical protein VI756_18815 [Blastocatellia bacterium]